MLLNQRLIGMHVASKPGSSQGIFGYICLIRNACLLLQMLEALTVLEAANIIEFTSEPAISSDVFCNVNGFHGCSRRGEGWQLRVDSLAEAVPQLIRTVEQGGAKLRTLTTHEATLEDLFVSLTGRELRDA